MHTHTGNPRRAWIPPERMQLARLAPGSCHALLAPIGERHGPGPRRKAEADLAAGAEKCLHADQRRCPVDKVVHAFQRRGQARHAARLCCLADACPLRNLLSALAPPALGCQLGGAGADLAEMLLIRGHRGDGGPLSRLQLGAQSIDGVVVQRAKCVGLDAVADRGKLHRSALYSLPEPPSRRATVHLLYYAHNGHRTRGRHSPWVRFSTTSSASSARARSSRLPSTTLRRMRSTGTLSTAWSRASRMPKPMRPAAPW